MYVALKLCLLANLVIMCTENMHYSTMSVLQINKEFMYTATSYTI